MSQDNPPVRAGDAATVTIGDLAYGGQGVARVSGFVVFVPGALPGETARVRVRRVHRGFAEADCLEILAPSSRRAQPPCRHFGACGGCNLQHLERAAQAEEKRRQVGELLVRVAGVRDPNVTAAIAAGESLRYRFRIDYDWGADAAGRPRLGLHAAGRPGEIVPVDGCLLVPEVADGIRAFLESSAGSLRLVPRGGVRGGGLMRRATLQMARTTGEIALTLETGRGDPPALAVLARDTARSFPRVVGTLRREYDRRDRFVAASILHGRDHLFEDVDGDRMRIPAGTFFQPNATAWTALRAAVREALAAARAGSLLELHCGVGFFTLPAARLFRDVVALDVSREAIGAARDNGSRAGLRNVRWLCRDAGAGLADLLEGGRFDAILLDPPREGLARGTSLALARSGARRIVYVSCDPATLARDLRVLIGEGGYRLLSVAPLDLLPQTHHVECVARLEREDEKEVSERPAGREPGPPAPGGSLRTPD